MWGDHRHDPGDLITQIHCTCFPQDHLMAGFPTFQVDGSGDDRVFHGIGILSGKAEHHHVPSREFDDPLVPGDFRRTMRLSHDKAMSLDATEPTLAR